MGYLVCHMQKHQRGAIKGIQYHNQREKESHSNNDIDTSRSHLNYDIINPGSINYNQVINDRIKQLNLKKAVRKDAVQLCSFIITSDQDTMHNKLGFKEVEYLFRDTVSFFQERYGKENVIFATVHHDEATPHLHIGVVPIKDGRLSAKALFNKLELTSLQTDLHQAVGAELGLERGVRGSTKQHLTEIEYKAQQEALKLKSIEEKLSTYLTNEEVEKVELLSKSFKNSINESLTQLEKPLKRSISHERDLDKYKSPMFDKNAVIVSKTALKELLDSESELNRLKQDYKVLEKRVDEFKETVLDRVDKAPRAKYDELIKEFDNKSSAVYIGNRFRELFKVVYEPIQSHFDFLHSLVERIPLPLEQVKDFALGFLEMSLQTKDLVDCIEVGVEAFNEGIDVARKGYDLSMSTFEHEWKQERDLSQVHKSHGMSL